MDEYAYCVLPTPLPPTIKGYAEGNGDEEKEEEEGPEGTEVKTSYLDIGSAFQRLMAGLSIPWYLHWTRHCGCRSRRWKIG